MSNKAHDKIYDLHVKERLTFSQLAERFCTSRGAIAGIVYKRKLKEKENVHEIIRRITC